MADEPTSAPRRAPQKKLTPEDKARLLEVLKRPDVRVDGKINIPTVVTLTGLKYGAVYNFLRSDRYWHAQVGEADPAKLEPGEGDQIDSQPPPLPPGITLTRSQFDEYQALIRQNKKMLAADWVALGMSDKGGDRMEHYARLGAAPMGQILRATGGQLISNLDVLDQVIKADAERILTGKFPAEFDRKGEPRNPDDIERDWRYALYAGMQLQLQMFSHMHKAQALMARVMSDLQKMNGVGNKPNEKGVYEAQTSAGS